MLVWCGGNGGGLDFILENFATLLSSIFYDANSCLMRLIKTLLLSKACYFALLFNFFGIDYQAYG